jgi:hypothetical protein
MPARMEPHRPATGASDGGSAPGADARWMGSRVGGWDSGHAMHVGPPARHLRSCVAVLGEMGMRMLSCSIVATEFRVMGRPPPRGPRAASGENALRGAGRPRAGRAGGGARARGGPRRPGGPSGDQHAKTKKNIISNGPPRHTWTCWLRCALALPVCGPGSKVGPQYVTARAFRHVARPDPIGPSWYCASAWLAH